MADDAHPEAVTPDGGAVPDPPELPAGDPPARAAAEAAEAPSVAAGWLRIREEVPAWMRWLLGAIPIAALIGLWWAVTAGATAEVRILSPTILPSPAEVVASFPSLWFDRALTRNSMVSFLRVVAGFAVGVAIAFPLGLLMGAFTKVKAMFNPLAVFGAYLPIPALVPLTLSLFGTGEKQKIAFLALAFVIYLLPLVAAAVESVDDVYLKTAYTLGATKLQAVRKVLLGVSWPDIYQALRMGFGIGWSYIILAEMVDIGRGLGGIIIISQRRGPREHIYLVLLVIVAIAFLTDKLWAVVGRRLFPYREGRA
jgi:ABC-type nitrate/sulfonate/bicarbonate transport system permease component